MGAQVPPSEWHPRHDLEVVEVKIWLPGRVTAATTSTTCTVVGRTSTRRGNLWSEANVWGPDERWQDGSDVADWCDHLVRSALHHMPTSPETLTQALLGPPAWDQPSLF